MKQEIKHILSELKVINNYKSSLSINLINPINYYSNLSNLLSKSIKYSFIYITKNNNINNSIKNIDNTIDTDDFYDNINEDILATFPTFFDNVKTIMIPKKVERTITRYLPKKLLKEIDSDVKVAIDKCLLFLSNLSSTYYSEDKWKSLHSSILHQQLKNDKDNTYIYTKVIKALKNGTDNGPIIETNDDWSFQSHTKKYKLSDTYLKCGLTQYNLKSEELIIKRRKMRYKSLIDLMDNTIAKNLLMLYTQIDLPTEKEILKRGKELVKQKYKTKKGKILTLRNKKTNEHWKNPEERSFVEDNIELFKYLTDLDYLIPVVNTESAGGRVTDSFNLMPSWIRKMIKINGEKISECDYKALHPNIAMTIFNGNQKYLTHQMISDKLGLDVSTVKTEHLSFFNKPFSNIKIGSTFIPGLNNSPLFEYYSNNEPKLMENLFNDKKYNGYKNTFRMMAQKETEIMSEVIKQLNEEDIFVGYVYDALFCKKSDVKKVLDTMNRIIISKGVFTIAECDDIK